MRRGDPKLKLAWPINTTAYSQSVRVTGEEQKEGEEEEKEKEEVTRCRSSDFFRLSFKGGVLNP